LTSSATFNGRFELTPAGPARGGAIDRCRRKSLLFRQKGMAEKRRLLRKLLLSVSGIEVYGWTLR